jgi:hypothetical protein
VGQLLQDKQLLCQGLGRLTDISCIMFLPHDSSSVAQEHDLELGDENLLATTA